MLNLADIMILYDEVEKKFIIDERIGNFSRETESRTKQPNGNSKT